jgi:hypothetical protein
MATDNQGRNPTKDEQVTARRNKVSAGGRPPNFDKQRYRDRNSVERAVNSSADTEPPPPGTRNASACTEA